MTIIMYGGPNPDWDKQPDWDDILKNKETEKIYVDRPLNEEEIRKIIRETIKEIDEEKSMKTIFNKASCWLLKQVTNTRVLLRKFKERNEK